MWRPPLLLLHSLAGRPLPWPPIPRPECPACGSALGFLLAFPVRPPDPCRHARAPLANSTRPPHPHQQPRHLAVSRCRCAPAGAERRDMAGQAGMCRDDATSQRHGRHALALPSLPPSGYPCRTHWPGAAATAADPYGQSAQRVAVCWVADCGRTSSRMTRPKEPHSEPPDDPAAGGSFHHHPRPDLLPSSATRLFATEHRPALLQSGPKSDKASAA